MNIRKPEGRVGRPCLIAEEARSHRVATFVTENEMDVLRAAADKNGKSISLFVYELLANSMFHSKKTQIK
jgi:hypothetical protein